MLKKENWFWLLNIFICLFLLLRGFYDYQSLQKRVETLAAEKDLKRGSYKGHVCSQVERSENWQRFTLCLPAPVLVYTKLYPEYNYGDFLSLKGEIEHPSSFSDFNYPLYLAATGIYFVSYYPRLESIAEELKQREQILVYLNQAKKEVRKLFNQNLPEPEASLANALMWGFKKDLFAEDQALFKALGISHLVVISGLHVSILGGIVLAFFYFLGLRRALSLVLTIIFLFTYLSFVGYSPALFRATLTSSLFLLALYHKRLATYNRVLMLTFNLVLAYRPVALYLDIGLQLSFLAIVGIRFIYPLHRLFFKKIRSSSCWLARLFSYFFSAFFLTLACQVISWPLIINNFQSFSYLSFLVNPSLAWLLPLILGSLFFAFLLSLILPTLSFYLFLPAYFCLALFFKIINLFNFNAGGVIAISPLSRRDEFIYYTVLVLIVILLRRKAAVGANKNPTF